MYGREGQAGFQLYLPVHLKNWLKGYAAKHDLSMTTIIRFLLERERARERAANNGETEPEPFFDDIFASRS